MRIKLFFGFVAIAIATLIIYFLVKHPGRMGTAHNPPTANPATPGTVLWTGPDSNQIMKDPDGALILYGRSLIANTAFYFGPSGKLSHNGNGMNCQNCHLNAGSKPWGNNYGGVFSTYPKFRERRGEIESISQRINDCFSRSLNGQPLDSNSHEMKAMLAYIRWLGKEVPKGKKPAGSGILSVRFLNRAADPGKGKQVYIASCQRCHGVDGQGLFFPGTNYYQYPPLWGNHSYNTGAGLFRLSRFAGYVKANMPFGISYNSSLLSDEEAWDVAAFVNSQPRPAKRFRQDWPDISLKPIDHPFGPYADGFSEQQHKYGPFAAIQKTRESGGKKKNS